VKQSSRSSKKPARACSPGRQKEEVPPALVDVLSNIIDNPIPKNVPYHMQVAYASIQAGYFLLAHSPQDQEEANLHFAQLKKARGNDDYTELFWRLSLIGLALYRRKGEQQALKTLPVLLSMDCHFFLGQSWVRALVASWHSQGEEKKIQHAFFGSPKRGGRSLHLLMENWKRDCRISSAVHRLLTDGCGTMRLCATLLATSNTWE
jgi:hypothetical protein